jgi:hypothetical protein
MGRASGYDGSTLVTGGSSFHLPAGGQWASAGAGNSGTFEVTGNGALFGGGSRGLGATPTKLYASSLEMAGGTTLSALPGGFQISVLGGANQIVLHDSVRLQVIIEAGMGLPVGTYTPEATGTSAAPATGAGSAALSFANASGVFTGAAGVILPGHVSLDVGAWGSLPVWGSMQEYVLIDGLNTPSIISSFGSSQNAVASIFGNDGKLLLMGAQFQLSFSENKLIMTQVSLSSTIPEPSTYALIGGLGALGLAFWRRRKAAKAAKAAKK